MYLQAHYKAMEGRKNISRLIRMFRAVALVCEEVNKPEYENLIEAIQRTHACDIRLYTHRDFIDEVPDSDMEEHHIQFELLLVDVSSDLLDILTSGYSKATLRAQMDSWAEKNNVLMVLM